MNPTIEPTLMKKIFLSLAWFIITLSESIIYFFLKGYAFVFIFFILGVLLIVWGIKLVQHNAIN